MNIQDKKKISERNGTDLAEFYSKKMRFYTPAQVYQLHQDTNKSWNQFLQIFHDINFCIHIIYPKLFLK